eukprot:188330-Prorocentrum_minimum.AAC.1
MVPRQLAATGSCPPGGIPSLAHVVHASSSSWIKQLCTATSGTVPAVFPAAAPSRPVAHIARSACSRRLTVFTPPLAALEAAVVDASSTLPASPPHTHTGPAGAEQE